MLNKITGSAIGIEMGRYAELSNPWILISCFLMFLCSIFIWMWRERKLEVMKLRRQLK